MFGRQYQGNQLCGKRSLRNDLLCVEGHMKPYSVGCYFVWYVTKAQCSRISVAYYFEMSPQDNPLPSARQYPSYGDCLEVKREYYQNSSVLDCVTQCLQSAAHLYEQFLQVNQIGFVTLGPLRCA